MASNAPDCQNPRCFLCPLKAPTELGKVLLQWVGRKFYSVGEFNDETEKINPITDVKLGISRRISALPRGFEIGKSHVFLAHLDCIPQPDGTYMPGVFRVFRPSRVEIICDGNESDNVIEGYLKRGLTPVIIERVIE